MYIEGLLRMGSDYLLEKGSLARGSQMCGQLVGDSLLMHLCGIC